MLPIEKLNQELQDILNMPRNGEIDADDINGEEARMEYYKEKYNLWRSFWTQTYLYHGVRPHDIFCAVACKVAVSNRAISIYCLISSFLNLLEY